MREALALLVLREGHGRALARPAAALPCRGRYASLGQPGRLKGAGAGWHSLGSNYVTGVICSDFTECFGLL